MAKLLTRTLCICATSIALLGAVNAHGGATHQKPLVVDPHADWATRHMAEEHHISNFDPGAFFSLHDFDDNGHWDADEIMKFYGMEDENISEDLVTDHKRHEVVDTLVSGMDQNDNGLIEREEWMSWSRDGHVLPDFGLGPGHHWDMETEYEIHHWEKYHDENTKEEDLTHPEDIAHFKKHDDLEDEEAAQAKLDAQAIVEHNIPMKFRRHES